LELSSSAGFKISGELKELSSPEAVELSSPCDCIISGELVPGSELLEVCNMSVSIFS
jgi:hypothetical protein